MLENFLVVETEENPVEVVHRVDCHLPLILASTTHIGTHSYDGASLYFIGEIEHRVKVIAELVDDFLLLFPVQWKKAAFIVGRIGVVVRINDLSDNLRVLVQWRTGNGNPSECRRGVLWKCSQGL